VDPENGTVQLVATIVWAANDEQAIHQELIDTVSFQSDLETAPVPEPATLTLTALGLAGVLTRYRRRRPRSSL
jgi:hypothetical protein